MRDRRSAKNDPTDMVDHEKMACAAIGVGAIDRFADNLRAAVAAGMHVGEQGAEAPLAVQRAAQPTMTVRNRTDFVLLQRQLQALGAAVHANPDGSRSHGIIIPDERMHWQCIVERSYQGGGSGT